MPTTAGHPRSHRAARAVVISAWAVPVLIVGQFAMLAIIPVTLALVASLRDARLRGLRRWTALLTATYAAALIRWAVGPERAPSLSKDLHPALAALIVAAALTVVVAAHRDRRRRAPATVA